MLKGGRLLQQAKFNSRLSRQLMQQKLLKKELGGF